LEGLHDLAVLVPKAQVRDDQLPVLAGVANYLQHTAGAKLTVLIAD